MGRDESVIIHGDEQFVRRIEQALGLLRQHPEFYEMVNTYTGTISPAPDGVSTNVRPWGGRHGVSPCVYICDLWLNESNTALAGILVHEAANSKLFFDYLNANDRHPPFHVWERPDGEVIALGIERDFLVAAGAPRHYIDWLDQHIRYYQQLAEERQAAERGR